MLGVWLAFFRHGHDQRARRQQIAAVDRSASQNVRRQSIALLSIAGQNYPDLLPYQAISDQHHNPNRVRVVVVVVVVC